MPKYSLTFAALLIGSAVGSASAAPQARKAVGTKPAASRPPAGTSRTRPARIGNVRKGKIPAATTRVRRKPVAKPSKQLVASKRARRPLRLAALSRPSKVSFSPCAASPPPQFPREATPGPGADAAVLNRAYQWPNGATLKVGFLDGSAEARRQVAELSKRWTEHANLELQFSFDVAPRDVDILIRFDDPACTSALGTSSRYRTEIGEPSMNLCHIDQRVGTGEFQRVALHELGHALGLEHEHQNPKIDYEWNKEAVYAYYADYGWSRSYVDQWVFRRISPEIAETSDYDPDSVMHYAFPAEFTANGVAFGGKNELSELDASFIAKMYPGRTTTPAKRRYERKLAVRNETGQALIVQAIYETKAGGKAIWAPEAALADAPQVRVPAGAERMLDGPGRRAKIIARSSDGESTWGTWAKDPLRVAPVDGYLDDELQTYVIVIDGPPDPSPTQTKAQLYASAAKALEAGRHEEARGLFSSFVQRFPADELVPWARFNLIVAWYEGGRASEALDESYALIVDHPEADATPYAWFYGGVASVSRGWCEGARSYFGYAVEERSGLPADWREIASEYLAAIEAEPDRWCW